MEHEASSGVKKNHASDKQAQRDSYIARQYCKQGSNIIEAIWFVIYEILFSDNRILIQNETPCCVETVSRVYEG